MKRAVVVNDFENQSHTTVIDVIRRILFSITEHKKFPRKFKIWTDKGPRREDFAIWWEVEE